MPAEVASPPCPDVSFPKLAKHSSSIEQGNWSYTFRVFEESQQVGLMSPGLTR